MVWVIHVLGSCRAWTQRTHTVTEMRLDCIGLPYSVALIQDGNTWMDLKPPSPFSCCFPLLLLSYAVPTTTSTNCLTDTVVVFVAGHQGMTTTLSMKYNLDPSGWQGS